MKMYGKLILGLLVIGIAALTFWIVQALSQRQQWFALQSQQMESIKRLEEFAPAGWDRDSWRNALVTPYNVWGNVTYAPSYSQLTIAQMRALQSKLDQIRASTTPENAFESVDRVFELLTKQCSNKSEFITGFREEFRTYGKDMEQPSSGAALSK